MKHSPLLALALLPLALPFAVACDPEGNFDDTCEPPAASWAPGTRAFNERTDDLGLVGVEGQRISAVDLDLDGDADLIVRRVNAGANDASNDDVAARSAWILENRMRDGQGFVDVSASSGFFTTRNGLALGRPGDVMAFADVDNDGDLDAYHGVSTADPSSPQGSTGETSEIVFNRIVETGELRFELAAIEDGGDVRRDGEIDVPAAAVFFDADRDGDVDLFVAQHNYGDTLEFVGDRFYDNDGTGRFTDVHVERGLVSQEWTSLETLNSGLAHTRSWAGVACDVNDDGNLDVMVASYGRAPNHLWRGKDGGEFVNVSVDSGYAYDDNFVFSDNQMFACHCQASPSTPGCEDAGSPQISCAGSFWDASSDDEAFRLGGNSATTLCADLDGDSDLDLVTTEIKHWWAGSGSDGADILENVSSGREVRFVRPGREATHVEPDHLDRVDWDEGIMSGAVLDFDNDGRVDIYLGGSDYPGNRGMLFHNDSASGALSFTPVDVGDFFEHNRSHGIAVADFDLDGDVDVVVGHSRSRCGAPNDCYETANVRYFENTLANANADPNAGASSLQLTLAGNATSTNAAAIGARVTVTTTLSDGSTRVQTQEVGGGYGHFGAQNDLTLSFGMAGACSADVVVRWPNASLDEQRFAVGAGRFLVSQGAQPSSL